MTEAEFHRRLERELDHASWRAARPLFLAMVLVLVCIWALFQRAEAATVPLTCKPPTTNTNGTPITGTISFRFYGGPAPVDSASGIASITVTDPAAGQSIAYQFQCTAIVAGMESAKSNTIAKTITTPLPTPSPPTLLTTDQVGYQLNLGTRNKITLSRVASVPIGKECIESMSVTDPYRTVYIIRDHLWAVMDLNPKKPGEFFTRPNQVWATCRAG